ncbi:MAG: hypothetical protein IJC50_02440 [Clostridia bacterium]|nr:hypothetical protein [Clostridia bacterium]
MAKYKKAQLNIPMCLAAVLLCLTMFSFHFTGGLYAKYIVRDSGDDSARVIKFGSLTISETGDFAESGKLIITPGVSLKKDPQLSFSGSESATYVYVLVDLSSHWSTSNNADFSVKFSESTVMSWQIASSWKFLKTHGVNGYVFYRELAPNQTITDADIIKNGTITVSESITRSNIKSLNDMYIKISAAVVQIGEFENASQGWDSLS